MTTVAPVAVETEQGGNQAVAETGDRALRWAGRAGWVVLGLQLAAMIAFSVAERIRFALTTDDATYFQAWYLISRGHLRGYSTPYGLSYLRVNGELITWPLALLSRPVLSQTSFLIFQDLCLVAAAAVGLIWVLEVVRRPGWPERFPRWLAVSLYVLLIGLNPWLYQSIAFAWHFEPFDVLVLVLAAYFVEHRHWKRAAVFVGLSMLTGATGAVLLSGLGITTLLCGRRWRRPGLLILLAGVGTLLVLSALKLTGTAAEFNHLASSSGTGTSNTAPAIARTVISVAEHPGHLLGILWGKRLNIYANLGPSGLIGVLSPWGFGIPFTSLLISELAGNPNLGVPSYQNAAVYVFATLGTVFLLRWIALARRIPRSVSLGLSGLVAVNAVLWAVAWLPRIPDEWLRVSAPAAAVLQRASDTIPPNAEVLASSGVMGAFAQRQWIYQLGARSFPVNEPTVYFVVTPNQGIESVNVVGSLAIMGYLAEDLHATLVDHGDGVWVFRWHPPAGQRTFVVGADRNSVPAWTAPGPAAVPVLSGRPANWLVAADGREGYVVAGDYWRRGTGSYRADVALSANVPVNVEVWNETSNTLLARRSLQATNGLQDVSFDVNVARLAQSALVSGGAPFKILPVHSAPGNSIEIRVWSAGNGGVSVYRLGFRPV